MSNIVLVAENGPDIPSIVAEKYGIRLVPMHVSFGDVTLDDRRFQVKRICAYKVFDEIHSRWPEKHVLHLAYSAVTTCFYKSTLAAAELNYVTSVNTIQVSVG